MKNFLLNLFFPKIKVKFSNNKYTIFISGIFDKRMLKSFYKAIKKIPNGQTVYIRIRSAGGNMADMLQMGNYLSEEQSNNKITFIAEIEYAASAALIFATCMNQCHTTLELSIGMIHLPIPAKGTVANKDELENRRERAITYWVKRCSLSRDEILKLDNTYLSGKKMFELKIADKVVEKF